MGQGNIYKPRNKISFLTKSKVWPDKNGYFRHFFSLRGRSLFRKQDLFVRCVLVATSIKWLAVRRSRRPSIIGSGIRRIQSASANKTAFGRPLKQRYRERFYNKQQLRLFHGEIKETTFRNFFKNHLKSSAMRTKSFFTGLESRLDIIFFRIRLLPTIFACRQFINHQGLEVNSVLQKSPRSLVSTGDMVALPNKVWKGFYFNIFQRIYYRRWGRYIIRRRLFKQIKKLSSCIRRFPRFYLSRIKRKKMIRTKIRLFSDKGLPQAKRWIQRTKNIKHKSLVIRLFKILSINNLQDKSKSRFGIKDAVFKTTKTIHKKKGRVTYRIQIEKQVQTIGVSNLIRVFSNSHQMGKPLCMIVPKWSKHKPNQARGLSSIKMKVYLRKEFTTIFSSLYDRIKTDNLVINDHSSRVKKILHYQKIVFSTRFRKIRLPRSYSYSVGKETQVSHHFFQRAKLRRFYFKKYKKSVQNKKRIRLKGVHFFIPNYLQIDFRTLRVIKVQSPNEDEIHHPFRISLPKRYSFYRSKGYLVI